MPSVRKYATFGAFSRVLALALALALALVASHARAQDTTPEEQLAQVREQVLYANYRGARTAAQAYLARTDLNAQQRIQGLELQAIVQIALRDERNAQRTIGEIYRRDPNHRLSDPDASPTVQAAFQRAHAAASTPITVTLESRTPDEIADRIDPVLSVKITEGADAIHELRAVYRQPGDAAFASTVMSVDESGVATARVPLSSQAEAYVLEYYVEARAPSDYVLARLGSESGPLTVGIPAAEARTVVMMGGAGDDGESAIGADGRPAQRDGDGGVFGKWWFWTAVGAVVIGGAAAAYFALGPPSEGPPTGDLGSGALR